MPLFKLGAMPDAGGVLSHLPGQGQVLAATLFAPEGASALLQHLSADDRRYFALIFTNLIVTPCRDIECIWLHLESGCGWCDCIILVQ